MNPIGYREKKIKIQDHLARILLSRFEQKEREREREIEAKQDFFFKKKEKKANQLSTILEIEAIFLLRISYTPRHKPHTGPHMKLFIRIDSTVTS